MRRILTFVLIGAGAPVAAECPTIAAGIAEAWLQRETIAAPQIADDAEALCVQEAVALALEGGRIGWKVGLTSEAAQQQFGVAEPVAGRLLDGMILADEARVPRDFGGRPVVEADLLVTVRDGAIMGAETHLEVLEHLESFVPFIELADLMVSPGEPLTGEIITAINVGARLGVAGEPVAMEASEEWAAALAGMTVRIEDGEGIPIGDYPGAAILGHPLDAVLWLTARLEAIGESLEAGDVVSLGSFGPPMPPGELGTVRVRYLGLPGGVEPSVAVDFE
jgi:2-keto-4-pentenoate hydratase